MLVKFKVANKTKDKSTYVNPDHVSHLYERDDKLITGIFFTEGTDYVDVFGDIDEVAAQLWESVH